ncbi:MAG: response regulator transcription factor [Bacteroidaceae bacterium]|nr:response regulator transcription factor [Bacteroidaceae bacterium]
MTVLIIEDEIMAQNNLMRMLGQYCADLTVVGAVTSVASAVEWLQDPSHKADILFMDVELADGVCFEIFRKVDVEGKVIMTTAYDTYAIKAFEAGSVDYLLKPIAPEALQRAVSRCRARSEKPDMVAVMNTLSEPKRYRERLVVKFNDRIVPVPTADIAYICSEEKCNYVVTSAACRYVLDASLDVVAEVLDPEKFFKISRSCIIASNGIKSIVKQSGRLRIVPFVESPVELTVSRSRVDDFMAWLER